MKKICEITGVEFEIYPQELEFYQKHDLPVPDISPLAALQRRLSWRNDMNLYRRKCDKTGKSLISMFAADSKMTVYDQDFWNGDEWDPLDYGQPYDFNRPFFQQFDEMNVRVPYPHAFVYNSENSDYTNYQGYNKNCYLCFAGNFLQDSMYCYNAQNSSDCIDCLFIYESQFCYECTQCENCYDLFFGLHCKECKNSRFLEDCISCRDCFMCWNLANKQYCILNKQYTKEEYEAKIKNIDWQKMRDFWASERVKYPKRADHNMQIENCDGEYMTQSKNCHDCYTMAKGGEDCCHIFSAFPDLKDAMRCCYSGEKFEIGYETLASGLNSQRLFCTSVCYEGCFDLFYCSNCVGCKSCLGCSNLRKKQCCILNKQYSKNEYEDLLPRIIAQMKSTGQWGNFFPTEISPFAYNESFAMQYFPLKKEEVLAIGWSWREVPDIQQEVSGENIYKCEVTGKPFKLLETEIKFYEKYGLPLPKKSFNQRHLDRVKLRNGLVMYDRKCAKTGVPIKTSYPPESPFIVYSNEAWLKEVY